MGRLRLRVDERADIQAREEGIANAYVVLPLGQFESEVRALRKLRAQLQPGVELKEILHLTGHADLLAQFTVPDFRKTVEIEYPQPESSARVVNWVFAVPCFEAGIRRELPADPLRFTMHLRLRRRMYESSPVERDRAVIAYVDRCLKRARCKASIQGGLGWSDYIVDGAFDPKDMALFVRYLVEIHEGCILTRGKRSTKASEVRDGVFIRTMTLLGFRWPLNGRKPKPPELPGVTPAIFVRAVPARIYDGISDLTGGRAAKNLFDVRLIDGKSDFVVLTTKPVKDILERNLELAKSLTKRLPRATHIQRLETHLVFSKARRARRGGGEEVIFDSDDAFEPRCRCSGLCSMMSRYRKTSSRLPDEFLKSVANALFLSDATLNDEMTCCDVSQAILAAEVALRRLFVDLDVHHEKRKKLERKYAVAYRRKGGDMTLRRQLKNMDRTINKRVESFELWHLHVERVLRQRTVASFEEMLMRSDRNVVFRGSVQKFLFLADALMNDFLRKINAHKDSGPPRMWAMYDATPRIISYPSLGLVRIPARYLFRLPVAVPDLWHEVGVFWFYQRVPLGNLKTQHAVTREWMNVELEQYLILGDRFADLVVYHVGLASNWERFLVSITQSWLDFMDRERLSPSVYEDNCVALLTRLAFIEDVSNRLDGKRKRMSEKEFVERVIQIYRQIRDRFGNVVPILDKASLVEAAGQAVNESLLYREFLARQIDRHVSFKKVNPAAGPHYAKRVDACDGRLMEFKPKDDLNVLFGELFWKLREKPIQQSGFKNPFQRTAAIIRSAIIEYHRRQAS